MRIQVPRRIPFPFAYILISQAKTQREFPGIRVSDQPAEPFTIQPGKDKIIPADHPEYPVVFLHRRVEIPEIRLRRYKAAVDGVHPPGNLRFEDAEKFIDLGRTAAVRPAQNAVFLDYLFIKRQSPYIIPFADVIISQLKAQPLRAGERHDAAKQNDSRGERD